VHPYRWATAITTLLAAAISAVAVVAAAGPPVHTLNLNRHPYQPFAEQAQARPHGAASGGCYVNGKQYPDGAMVPLDPGPRSLMVAPIYVRCVRGRLCYDRAPAVCIPADGSVYR
jgi:hypothetical protein